MNAQQVFELETGSGRVIEVSQFAERDYEDTHQLMTAFANGREDGERDRIWLLQHPAVYTQGTACQQQPLYPSAIPVIKSDRGGQITYHGPGQLVVYPMLKLRDYGLGVKSLVQTLEQSVIDLLDSYGIAGERREDAPGVYLNQAKIAALGLRIRRGTSYHGLSLNIDMDLQPFRNIDPCGYQGLEVTQLADHVHKPVFDEVATALLNRFVALI
ncbi:MAG: lipoyl(octanoyl) transferase LipB [Pseudomonadota bacterium]